MPVWAYIGGGALLAGALAGWTVRDWKADAALLKAQEKTQEREQELEAIFAERARFYEDQIADLSSRSYTNQNTIREIYRDVEIPTECAPPPDLRGVLDDAVKGANAAVSGEPVAQVPASSGAASGAVGPRKGSMGGAHD